MSSFRCYDNSDVIATLIIINFRLYLIQLWWQFFQMFVHGDVVYAQTWQLLTLKTVSSHFICQYDLCCCIVWPSFLFDCFVKIWANCKNFLGKWFTVPLSCIKLPVRLSSHEKPITKYKPPRGSFTFGLLLRASSWQFLKSGAPGTHNSMLCELY